MFSRYRLIECPKGNGEIFRGDQRLTQGAYTLTVRAEFKSLHSKDLLHGLEYQLPAYMKNKKVEHGTYCVLDFRGEWFSQPDVDDEMLSAELGRARRRADLPPVPPIKIHYLRLGKIKSASRK